MKGNTKMINKILATAITLCVGINVAFSSGCDNLKDNTESPLMTRKTIACTGAVVAIDEGGNVLNTPWCEYAGMPADENISLGWKDIVEIDCGGELMGSYSAAGLRKNGTVITYGANYSVADYDVSDWCDIKSISLYDNILLGLKNNGTVVAVPEPANETVSNWEGITDIAVDMSLYAGVRSDGRVIYSIDYDDGNIHLIEDEAWTDIVSVDIVRGDTFLGLKSDGTVVVFAADGNQLPYGIEKVQDWKNIAAISVNKYIIAGLKNDGTVTAIYSNFIAENTEDFNLSDWSDIIEIEATKGGLIGLKKDGTLVFEGSFNEDLKKALQWQNLRAIN